MSFIKEFKDFASRGNVVDLSVGIVIGAAFGKIVSSVVSDIIMPPIGLLVSGINFTDIKWTLKDAVVDANGKETVAAVSIKVGSFIQSVFDFMVVAIAVFLVVKGVNKIKKKDEKIEPEAIEITAPKLSKDQELLSEIRDLLKDGK